MTSRDVAPDAVTNGSTVPDDVVEAEAGVVSLPETGETGEGGKLKMIMQLIKRCLGVKDIAAMSVSFASQHPPMRQPYLLIHSDADHAETIPICLIGVYLYPPPYSNRFPTSSIGNTSTDLISSLRESQPFQLPIPLLHTPYIVFQQDQRFFGSIPTYARRPSFLIQQGSQVCRASSLSMTRSYSQFQLHLHYVPTAR